MRGDANNPYNSHTALSNLRCLHLGLRHGGCICWGDKCTSQLGDLCLVLCQLGICRRTQLKSPPQYAAPTHTGTLANDSALSVGIANPAIPERLGREGLLLHSQAAAERALMRQAWKPPWHLALPTPGRDERSVQGCDRAVTAATVAQQGIAAR